MLTDIFAYRYLKYPIWLAYTESERRLLNQTIALAKEVYPYRHGSSTKNPANEALWERIHHRLARELGVTDLAPRVFSYTTSGMNGTQWTNSAFYDWDRVCEIFVTALPTPHVTEVDTFIKERISLIELVMRNREEEVAEENARFPRELAQAKHRDLARRKGMTIPGSAANGVELVNTAMNAGFRAQVEELNERFRRAGAPLRYHNGYIQVATDELIEQQVQTPFWDLVAAPQWKNVSIDMAEALDRRDSNDKDPALFAAKALESAIKIISDTKGLTRGNETGASGYIDNLVSKNNGSFLDVWEGEMLREYFRKVRNFLGHGPGSLPMPALTPVQTDWAIETAMSWVRTLVRRA